jgi:hypothetical protein
VWKRGEKKGILFAYVDVSRETSTGKSENVFHLKIKSAIIKNNGRNSNKSLFESAGKGKPWAKLLQ